MPELPEVETMVRGVRPALLGRRIESATLSHTDILRGVTRPKLLKALIGATITDVTRRAKHGVVHLDALRFVLQPGMTGNQKVSMRKRSTAATARSDDNPIAVRPPI